MAQYDLFEKRSRNPSLDVDAYLKRIDCKREYRPSLRWLKNLHRNHLLHIPFENLDIHIGNQIILDIDKIFDKVIRQNRGGFCYELNGLFYHLLAELGFNVKILSAKVMTEEGNIGLEFEHLMAMAYLDDKQWLIDVGYGSSFSVPKEFALDLVQMDYNRFFKIIERPDGSFMLQSSNDSLEFKDEYIFTKKERQFVEFIGMCQYHQTSPKSRFKQKKLITQMTKDGRITLTDKKFITDRMGKKEEHQILNNDEFLVKLREQFGVRLRKNT